MKVEEGQGTSAARHLITVFLDLLVPSFGEINTMYKEGKREIYPKMQLDKWLVRYFTCRSISNVF